MKTEDIPWRLLIGSLCRIYWYLNNESITFYQGDLIPKLFIPEDFCIWGNIRQYFVNPVPIA